MQSLPWRAALLYCTAALLAAAVSVDAYRSTFSVLVQVILGLWCAFVFWRARDEETRLAMLRWWALASLGIFAINFVPWLSDGAPLVWRVVNEKNAGVAMFNVIFIVALAVGELKRPLWWPWLAAFAWLTWFTGSRGAVLGVSVSVAAWLAITHIRSWWPLGLAPLGLLAAAFDGGRLTSLSQRDRYWALGWEMFSTRPFTGWGPDTYKAQYVGRFPTSEVFTHAHNLYLNTLAEGGIIAFIAMLVLVGSVLWLLWQRRSNAWAAGALAMLIGLLVHSLVDTPTSSLIVSIPMLAFIGLGLRADARA